DVLDFDAGLKLYKRCWADEYVAFGGETCPEKTPQPNQLAFARRFGLPTRERQRHTGTSRARFFFTSPWRGGRRDDPGFNPGEARRVGGAIPPISHLCCPWRLIRHSGRVGSPERAASGSKIGTGP